MAILVRTLQLDIWPESGFVGTEDDIPADCITSHALKTKNNQISVWRIDDLRELSEVVLAIVPGYSKFPGQGISFILLEEDELRRVEIDIRPNSANTKVSGLGGMHRDLSGLNYKSLGMLALHIVKRIEQEAYEEVTVREVVGIIDAAIGAGRLRTDTLAGEFMQGFAAQKAKYV